MAEEQEGGNVVNPVQVQKYLEGLDYPATKQELVEYAKAQGADENVVSTLENMPEQEFQTPAEVSQAIGMER